MHAKSFYFFSHCHLCSRLYVSEQFEVLYCSQGPELINDQAQMESVHAELYRELSSLAQNWNACYSKSSAHPESLPLVYSILWSFHLSYMFKCEIISDQKHVFCCSSWCIELSSIHMHGFLSGNGPSGICLSYLLSGYTPYLSPDGIHPNPILHNKLIENPRLSLFDQVMHTHNPPIYIYYTSLHNKWWLVSIFLFCFFTKSLHRLLQGLVNVVNDTHSHVKYRFFFFLL